MKGGLYLESIKVYGLLLNTVGHGKNCQTVIYRLRLEYEIWYVPS